MATANFKCENASAYYCFGSGYDQLDYRIHLENSQQCFEQRGWEADDGWDRCNNFPGRYFACKTLWATVCGEEWVPVTLKCKAVSGYYDGACYDFDINIDGCTYDLGAYPYDENEALDALDLYARYHPSRNYSPALQRANAPHLAARVNRLIQTLAAEAEELFATLCTDKLVCVARFSNGEAIYQRADNPVGLRPATQRAAS